MQNSPDSTEERLQYVRPTITKLGVLTEFVGEGGQTQDSDGETWFEPGYGFHTPTGILSN